MRDRPDAAPAPASLENVLEALLMASDAPLSIEQLQRVVGETFAVERKQLRAALQRLSERYVDSACCVVEVAGGWRLQIRDGYSSWLGRLWQERPQRLSRALLETLALIIYRQPITRGEIEEVRGVAVSSNILRTLSERGWIRELGHKEVPGRPMLYGSTTQLLDDLGLKSLSQLPEIPEIKPLEQLEATLARLGVDLPAGGDNHSAGGGNESGTDMAEGRASPTESFKRQRD